jgi:hypothetical protein
MELWSPIIIEVGIITEEARAARAQSFSQFEEIGGPE